MNLQYKAIPIYIGYDSAKPFVHRVCRYSIEKRSTINTYVYKVGNTQYNWGFWYRQRGPYDSTDFSNAKFLVPRLNFYHDIALFCDDDFLWHCDIKEVIELYDPKYAVMVVQHDYNPKSTHKFQNYKQTTYKYKNWSSLMLFNCGHKDCRNLSLKNVNEKPGLWLNQFEWTDNIGSLPLTYNHLVDEYKPQESKAYHFTLGGPWYKETETCSFASLWTDEYNEYKLKL